MVDLLDSRAKLSGLPRVGAFDAGSLVVRLYKRQEQVAEPWKRLEATGIDRQGQSFAAVRQLIADANVPVADQFYLIAEMSREPVALLPLMRRKVRGVRMLTWFEGLPAGEGAAVVDAARLRPFARAGRAELWTAMVAELHDIDLLYMPSMAIGRDVDLFRELGILLLSRPLLAATRETLVDRYRPLTPTGFAAALVMGVRSKPKAASTP